jgi:hypothetical protein
MGERAGGVRGEEGVEGVEWGRRRARANKGE